MDLMTIQLKRAFERMGMGRFTKIQSMLGRGPVRKMLASNMLSPESRNIFSMLPFVHLQPELAAFASIPREPEEHTGDMEAAMPSPYHLQDSMAAPLDKQLQQVIEHYYLNPNPVHVESILNGHHHYDPRKLWRQHHGEDHVARTAVILEAVIQFHKELGTEYVTLFDRHPDLDRLLHLAMVYHDAGAEVVDKNLEELLASRVLERDLQGAEISPETLELVVSALKNKNVNTMDPIPEGYTPDTMAGPDEQLIRRLLRIPDSVDIARVRTVSDDFSFTPPDELSGATAGGSIYSMHWMNLDPKLSETPELMEDWIALMKTAVFWASLTGASPYHLRHHNPAKLMPYTVSPNLVSWTDEVSHQRKLVVSRAPNSVNYVREVLHDIVRLFVAQEAGKTVITPFQLRQIKLPEDWTTLDSFLHFTETRKEKLRPVIDYWKDTDFTSHPGTLTGSLLSRPEVIMALEQFQLSAEKVKRQRGYNPDTGEPEFEDAWEVTPKHINE